MMSPVVRAEKFLRDISRTAFGSWMERKEVL